MIDPKHPDVLIFVNYSTGEERFHLHICPLETVTFPFGLELAGSYPTRVDADKQAEQVQKYLNAMRK